MQHEQENTRRLLLRYSLLTFLIPLLSAVIVALYARFAGLDYANSDWKRVVLCIWLGTLVVLVKEARSNSSFRILSRQKRRVLYEVPAAADRRRARTIADWESRKSRGLLKELWITGLMLPAVSLLLATLGAFLLGIELNRQAWKIIILIVWLGALCGLVRNVWRMGSADIIHDGR